MNRTHTVLDHDHASSMVIYNLNIKYISGCPGKTHTPLFVDTDAVLACTVSFQCLQAVAWRRPQKIKSRRSIQLNQLPLSHSMDDPPPLSSYRLSMQFIIRPDISENVPSFHLDQIKVVLILKVHPDLLRCTKVTSKLYCHFRADISLLVNDD